MSDTFKLISASEPLSFLRFVNEWITNKELISIQVIRTKPSEATPTGFYEAYIITRGRLKEEYKKQINKSKALE